jgi:hypothetical protein
MSARQTAAAPQVSSPVVLEWRHRRLLAAGFAPEAAARLAEDWRIDLHAVLELIDRGCPPPVAARIRAPLDDDRRSC